MNTIPSTFSAELPPYTVLGTGANEETSRVSAVVLSRRSGIGRVGRRVFFEELAKCGFDQIVLVDSSSETADVEEVSALFPAARFILIRENVSAGAKINAAANEVCCPLFFVLWDDQRVSGIKAERIHERLLLSREGGTAGGKTPERFYRRLCTVPVIQNQTMETIPTMQRPHIITAAVTTATAKVAAAAAVTGGGLAEVLSAKKIVECIPLEPEYDDFPTLYPFDAAGVYDRARFVTLGGFDSALSSPYWQYLDFGLRAWLWGEEIRCDKPLRLCVDGEIAREKISADASYRRFFLKNLAPVYKRNEKKVDLVETMAAVSAGMQPDTAAGTARLPLSSFVSFALRSGMGAASWRLFSEIRRWVKQNAARFTTDSRTLLSDWQGKTA